MFAIRIWKERGQMSEYKAEIKLMLQSWSSIYIDISPKYIHGSTGTVPVSYVNCYCFDHRIFLLFCLIKCSYTYSFLFLFFAPYVCVFAFLNHWILCSLCFPCVVLFSFPIIYNRNKTTTQTRIHVYYFNNNCKMHVHGQKSSGLKNALWQNYVKTRSIRLVDIL